MLNRAEAEARAELIWGNGPGEPPAIHGVLYAAVQTTQEIRGRYFVTLTDGSVHPMDAHTGEVLCTAEPYPAHAACARLVARADKVKGR